MSAADPPEIKHMNIKEFRETGYLHEVNRRLLHPAGLALSIAVDDETGVESLGSVWDSREDPEGWVYGDDLLSPEKARNVQTILDNRREARVARLGSMIQPVGDPELDEPQASQTSEVTTPVRSSSGADEPQPNEPVEGEVVLVARDNDAEQRPITATYDPTIGLVQFIEYGEEVFGTLEPVTEKEWSEIVGRLGRAAPFMERVLELVQAVEAVASKNIDRGAAEELRAATARFAGGIEPEQVVEVAHAADEVPEPPYPAELLDDLAKALALRVSGEDREIADILDRYCAEVGREQCPDDIWQAMSRASGS